MRLVYKIKNQQFYSTLGSSKICLSRFTQYRNSATKVSTEITDNTKNDALNTKEGGNPSKISAQQQIRNQICAYVTKSLLSPEFYSKAVDFRLMPNVMYTLHEIFDSVEEDNVKALECNEHGSIKTNYNNSSNNNGSSSNNKFDVDKGDISNKNNKRTKNINEKAKTNVSKKNNNNAKNNVYNDNRSNNVDDDDSKGNDKNSKHLEYDMGFTLENTNHFFGQFKNPGRLRKRYCSPLELQQAGFSLFKLHDENPEFDDNLKNFHVKSIVVATRVASDYGDKNAKYQLANLLYHGIGFSRCLEEAAMQHMQLAQQSHPHSQLQFGLMCIRGEGLKQNSDMALSVLQTAATNGMSFANTLIGEMYVKGTGSIDVNVTKGVEYFEKAEKAGDMSGVHNLGLLYYNGEMVTKNEEKALAYFRKAAESGNIMSMGMLATIHREDKRFLDFREVGIWMKKIAEIEKKGKRSISKSDQHSTSTLNL